LKSIIAVAVVEDHPEFRDALCGVLGSSLGIQLLEPCKDLPAGLRLLEAVCPDILPVDLGLPSGSGLDLIHEAERRVNRFSRQTSRQFPGRFDGLCCDAGWGDCGISLHNHRMTLGALRLAATVHTCRIGPGYFATMPSAVTSVMPSAVACAIRMRSKVSLWMEGRLST